MTSDYPDIADLIARKQRGRSELASLPFAEKIEILEKMRQQVEPLRRAREDRKAAGRTEPK